MEKTRKMNELPIEWDVTIELSITWQLICKIVQAMFKRQKLRILYTFTNNPLHRHQDMSVNEFWRYAYLGDDLKKGEMLHE